VVSGHRGVAKWWRCNLPFLVVWSGKNIGVWSGKHIGNGNGGAVRGVDSRMSPDHPRGTG
jgi:hypothetical protein